MSPGGKRVSRESKFNFAKKSIQFGPKLKMIHKREDVIGSLLAFLWCTEQPRVSGKKKGDTPVGVGTTNLGLGGRKSDPGKDRVADKARSFLKWGREKGHPQGK